MVCMYCGAPTSVVNSRSRRRQNSIWRRRKCVACGLIITTRETADLSGSLLVRTPRQRQPQPFSRDKLFVSILESCRHRPQAFEDAASITETVISKLLSELPDGVIDSSAILQKTQSILLRFDPVAATLYAADRAKAS